MKNDVNPFQVRRAINRELAKIPKRNREKFVNDYLYLIKKAQKDDYC